MQWKKHASQILDSNKIVFSRGMQEGMFLDQSNNKAEVWSKKKVIEEKISKLWGPGQ